MATLVAVKPRLLIPPHQLHLRVYEPLVAFPSERRRVWTQYVAAHPPSNEELNAQLYEESVRANAIANGPRLPTERTPHAYIARHEGQIMISPVQLRFRSIRAAEGRPDLFSPTGLAHGAAAALLASLRDEREEFWDVDDDQIHARIAAWSAPISWLLMFRPEDRCNPGPQRLLLRASLQEVGQRLEVVQQELEAMRGGIAPATSEMAKLSNWLRAFHPKGLVELDYGGAVRSLLANRLLRRDENDMPFDEGLSDLLGARAALRAGNLKGAIGVFRRVYKRINCANLLAQAS